MQRYGPGVALIVVDVQNDFVDPNGSLSVRGGKDVVPRVNREIDAAIGSGAIAVYTQDWHPESTPHFAKDGGTWPVHCVMGTWGAEFHPDLTVGGPVVRKGTNGENGYSGFSMWDPTTGETRSTGLADMLADAGVTRLVVCG